MKYFVYILTFFAVQSCLISKKGNPNSASGKEYQLQELKENVWYTPKLIFSKEKEYKDRLSYTIKSVFISTDSLIVDIEYSGGCNKHEFNLYFNELWMKSKPPKINLYLDHKRPEEFCEELLSERLIFDISDLKSKSNDMIINVVGYPPQIKY